EGLVDVHAIELLSVGVEANHPVLAQQRLDRLDKRIGLNLQTAQEAIAADGQQQRPKALLQAIEEPLQIGQQRPRSHGGENDAVLHRAVEGHAEVVMYLLNRAHGVVIADAYRQWIAGEYTQIERLKRYADQ